MLDQDEGVPFFRDSGIFVGAVRGASMLALRRMDARLTRMLCAEAGAPFDHAPRLRMVLTHSKAKSASLSDINITDEDSADFVLFETLWAKLWATLESFLIRATPGTVSFSVPSYSEHVFSMTVVLQGALFSATLQLTLKRFQDATNHDLPSLTYSFQDISVKDTMPSITKFEGDCPLRVSNPTQSFDRVKYDILRKLQSALVENMRYISKLRLESARAVPPGVNDDVWSLIFKDCETLEETDVTSFQKRLADRIQALREPLKHVVLGYPKPEESDPPPSP